MSYGRLVELGAGSRFIVDRDFYLQYHTIISICTLRAGASIL